MVFVKMSGIDGGETLDEIIHEIYQYLQNQSVRRFNRFLGKNHTNRIAMSWTEINVELSHFVKDPKNKYTDMMKTIEQEKNKFPHKADYVKKLNKLQDFLRTSPSFSNDYECNVRMPDGFAKRKQKKC